MSEAEKQEPRVFDPYSIPLDGNFDPSDGYVFQADKHWEWFERLRKESPVHFTQDSEFGPYWSVTKYNDIMHVDTNHDIFSSEGGITLVDQDEDFPLPMFIAMDPPIHDVQRKTVSPVVAPMNLAKMEGLIRERVCKILDGLPVGEEFDWVENVSIELTTQMLATLFDSPFEDRRKLTRWSDVATANEESGIVEDEDQRRAELIECLEYFTELWKERVGKEGNDLITMLANSEETKDMLERPAEYLGNLVLLIVGGNDTTRNSLTGGVLALNQFPAEFDKLKANPKLIASMVPEIIRWQTPLAHMRRRALVDTELGGQQIKAGDKVVMWYVSGNRDEEVIENPNEFIIDRKKPRQHLSFGFGIHRCMGNRLGEMQLRIAWEEILKRFSHVEVVGEPERTIHAFVKGFTKMIVKLHPK